MLHGGAAPPFEARCLVAMHHPQGHFNLPGFSPLRATLCFGIAMGCGTPYEGPRGARLVRRWGEVNVAMMAGSETPTEPAREGGGR